MFNEELFSRLFRSPVPWSFPSPQLKSPLLQCTNIAPDLINKIVYVRPLHTWQGWHWRYWGNQWLSYCSGGVERRYLGVDIFFRSIRSWCGEMYTYTWSPIDNEDLTNWVQVGTVVCMSFSRTVLLANEEIFATLSLNEELFLCWYSSFCIFISIKLIFCTPSFVSMRQLCCYSQGHLR